MDLDGIVSRALAAFRAAADVASLENAKARVLGKCGELAAFRPSGTPVETWSAFVTERTRVLVVNTPHNPTG